MLPFEINIDMTLVMRVLTPLSLVIIGYLSGFAVDRLLIKRLDGDKPATIWRGNKVFIAALRGMSLIWGTLIGVYLAILSIDLDDETTRSLLQMLQVPLVLSVTFFVMRLTTGFLDYYNEARSYSGSTISLSRSLTRATILLLGVLVLLQSLGISITPIIATLGITGLAASLALEETLSNVFSGMYIIFSKQTQPGDYVRLKVDERDQVEGYITDINWRSTRIRMLPQRLSIDPSPSVVNVPNSRMASDIVVLHYRPGKEVEIQIDALVPYGSDLEQVERVTIEVARHVLYEALGKTPLYAPFVRYRDFTPNGVGLTLVMYGGEMTDQHLIKHLVIKQLYRRYQQEGINLAFSDSNDSALLAAIAQNTRQPAAEE